MAGQQRGPINGLDPLIYTGGLPNLVVMDRRPTVKDYAPFFLGHWWIIPKTNDGSTPEKEIWVLVGKQQGLATWKRLQGGGSPTNDLVVGYQLFTTAGSGTYTPTAGMKQCYVECIGAGGGAGTFTGAVSGPAMAYAGGAGGYSAKLFTAEDIGTSQSYIVGAGGIAGTPKGATGGSTTFGSFLTCTGGTGGYDFNAATTMTPPVNGLGGTGSGGDINIKGGSGFFSIGRSDGPESVYGDGGNSFFAPGGEPVGALNTTPVTGNNGSYGSGGGGVGWASSGAVIPIILTGGNGGDGFIRITEYFA